MPNSVEKSKLAALIKEFDNALHETRKCSNAKKEAKNRHNKIHGQNRKTLRSLYKVHNYCLSSRYLSITRENQEVTQQLNEAELNYQESMIRLEKAKINLALAAGMPKKHTNNLYIDNSNPTVYNIYFGGEDGPVGKKHGHYAIKRDGEFTYRRERNCPHGPQNRIRHNPEPSYASEQIN